MVSKGLVCAAESLVIGALLQMPTSPCSSTVLDKRRSRLACRLQFVRQESTATVFILLGSQTQAQTTLKTLTCASCRRAPNTGVSSSDLALTIRKCACESAAMEWLSRVSELAVSRIPQSNPQVALRPIPSPGSGRHAPQPPSHHVPTESKFGALRGRRLPRVMKRTPKLRQVGHAWFSLRKHVHCGRRNQPTGWRWWAMSTCKIARGTAQIR